MIKALLRKKSDTSFSYDESNEDESIGFIEDLGYEATNNICDSDIRNAELVFDYHHADPFEVMRIQTYDDAPMAKRNDEVAIRIEVSMFSYLKYFFYNMFTKSKYDLYQILRPPLCHH